MVDKENFKQAKMHIMEKSTPYFDLLEQKKNYETIVPPRQILFGKQLEEGNGCKETVKIYASRSVVYAYFYWILK